MTLTWLPSGAMVITRTWGYAAREDSTDPGVLPSVELQPIRTRVEMLSTGLNAKIGLKVYGDSLERCEKLAVAIERLLRRELPGARSISAIRANGKPYLEFHIDREAIARYGVNIRDVQDVIEVAVGDRSEFQGKR